MSAPTWWQDAICYQVYPRSFADSNGDGIGDLPGIISKLDYLQDLGVTTLWLSPFYPSPQFDCGYDIADFTAVNPEYGTMEDFKALLHGVHQRGMHLLLDVVLNHTSDQHPRFQESKSSRQSPYRNWYIWRDGRPPNDWESFFGGSAWEYDPLTNQSYYHYFFPQQPDLNWREPAVKAALFQAMRFWLDLGVDGFRLDAIGTIYEDPALPPSGVSMSMEEMFLKWGLGIYGKKDVFKQKMRYQHELEEIHTLMKALRALIDEYDERLLLGEIDSPRFYGNGKDELHSVFHFDLMNLRKLEAQTIRTLLQERRARLPQGAWESNTIGNHDRPRSFSVYSDGLNNEARARLALAMVMFLPGTPTFYYGEELGMCDFPITNPADFRDNLATWVYNTIQQKQGIGEKEALDYANLQGRDKCRTPMQWRNSPNAGFSPAGVRPWPAVHPNYTQGVTVEAQERQPDSMLQYFRQIAQLRQQHPALQRGQLEFLDSGPILAFWREAPQERCLVALNMADAENKLGLPPALTTLFASQGAVPSASGLSLAPYEVWVGKAP